MNVYLMQRFPPGSARTGEIAAMVVIAGRADQARRLAAGRSGAEGGPVWTDPARSSCKLVRIDREGVALTAVQS